jgi:hypothetical protein
MRSSLRNEMRKASNMMTAMLLRSCLVTLILAFAPPAMAEDEVSLTVDGEAPAAPAITAAKALALAIMKADAVGFRALVPPAGLEIKGKRLTLAELDARLKKQRVPEIVGIEKGAASSWIWRVQTQRAAIWIMHGSGYGKTRVGVLSLQKDGAWRLTAVKDVDLGSP